MKRFPVRSTMFVLMVVGVGYGEWVLGQEKGQKSGQEATAIPCDECLPPLESLPTLGGAEKLKQQQAIQEITELRAQLGSVVGSSSDDFAQLVQHLVEGDDKPADSEQPKRAPEYAKPSPGGQDGMMVPGLRKLDGLVEMWRGYEKVPGPGCKDGINLAVGWGVPGQPAVGQGSYTSEYTPAGVVYRPVNALTAPTVSPLKKPSADQIDQIRNSARQLDEVANDLEEVGQYQAADQLRSQAQSLRQACRN